MTEIVGKAPPSSLGQASPARRRPTTTRRRRRIRNDTMRAARPNCSTVVPGRTSSLRLSRKRRAKTPKWPRRKGHHHESNVAWPQKGEARWLGTLVPCQGLETILAEDKPVVGAPTVKFIWCTLCLYLFSLCMLMRIHEAVASATTIKLLTHAVTVILMTITISTKRKHNTNSNNDSINMNRKYNDNTNSSSNGFLTRPASRRMSFA
jgi:hypothetical protein